MSAYSMAGRSFLRVANSSTVGTLSMRMSVPKDNLLCLRRHDEFAD